MTPGNFPLGDMHIDNQLILKARAGPDKAISAKEAEQSNFVNQGLSLSYPKGKPNRSHESGLGPSPMYLGTDHFESLLKNLNQNIELVLKCSLDLKQEKNHVPHLAAIARALDGLVVQQVRLARLVGRLYTHQGWDLKYVHAINTEGVRKLQARGGFEAILAAHVRAGQE